MMLQCARQRPATSKMRTVSACLRKLHWETSPGCDSWWIFADFGRNNEALQAWLTRLILRCVISASVIWDMVRNSAFRSFATGKHEHAVFSSCVFVLCSCARYCFAMRMETNELGDMLDHIRLIRHFCCSLNLLLATWLLACFAN